MSTEPRSDRVKLYAVKAWQRVYGHSVNPKGCRAETVHPIAGRRQCQERGRIQVEGFMFCAHHAGAVIKRGLERV